MENEKNLSKAPAAQELPDESLDTVTGGGERVYYKNSAAVKHSYELGQCVVAKPRGEERPMECWIQKKTCQWDSNGCYASYIVLYHSFKYKRNLTITIREEDIKNKIY